MDHSDQLIEVCRGQGPAMVFCLAFLRWVHWLDDAADQDVSWTVEETLRLNLEAMACFSHNEFFQQHREVLLALVTQAALAWADSNDFAQRADPRDQIAAQVLKSAYHTVFWQAAEICGGPEHAEAMTQKFRIFNYDLPATCPAG